MLKAATVPASQTRKYANYVCDTSIVVAQKACQRVRALSNAPEKPSDAYNDWPLYDAVFVGRFLFPAR